MKPHKHKDLIIAWANGATVQTWVDHAGKWVDNFHPYWIESDEYRIKPEPKPDFHDYYNVSSKIGIVYYGKDIANDLCNLKLTFDGETGKLKSAEVIS